MRGRGTRRLASLALLSLLFSVLMTGSAVAARVSGHTVDSFTFGCTLNGQPVGGGTVRFATTTTNGDTVGWYRFDGDNGQHRRYKVDYTSTTDPSSGSSTAVGTIVSNGGFTADWLYIDGTAVYAPNGLLGSYTGTATDICQDLGYGA